MKKFSPQDRNPDENKTQKTKRKAVGGRPKSRVKREREMKIRLTNAEEFLIKSKASQAGMQVSTWFRAAAKNARVVPRLTQQDMQSMHTLAGMANNLNQLTRLAHREGFFSIVRLCASLLSEIDKALTYFNRDDREDS